MVQHNITVYIKLSAGYFYHAVIRQINSKLQISPSNPLALELLMIDMFKFLTLPPPPSSQAKVVFKCLTLEPDLMVKCPYSRNKH